MNEYLAVQLAFKTPVHIGEVGIGMEEVSEILHSDTIFSALVNALSTMDEDVERFILKVKNGEIRFSSGFPFKNSDFYFPKPLLRPNMDEECERKWGKKLKEAKFLPKWLFEKWINYEKIAEEEIERLASPEFYRKSCIPKVFLDREGRSSAIYHVGVLEFERQTPDDTSGFFFLLISDEEGRTILKKALKFLQDEGIGGKRTWGLGLFEHEIGKFELRIPEIVEGYVLLSLFYPSREELTLFKEPSAQWDFVKRGGWVFSRVGRGGKRKPKMRMISEGSVFSGRKKPEGILLDLDEIGNFTAEVGHKVLQNGKAFSIPVRRLDAE